MAKKTSGRARIEEEAERLTEPVAEKNGVRIYDVEYVKEGSEYYLNIYIDKDGGVMIDDCEAVSRRLDPLLDEADFIEDAYTLEVSSPGLGRQLKRPRDFDYASGRDVELSLFRAVDGRKAYTGTLTASDEKTVAVLIDGETTLKRVYKYPGRVELRPENPLYKVIQIEGSALASFRILGKAVSFISEVR